MYENDGLVKTNFIFKFIFPYKDAENKAHHYYNLSGLRVARVCPTGQERDFKSFTKCQNANELNLTSYGENGLKIGDDVFSIIDGQKYLGKVETIIKKSTNSKKVYVGGKFYKNISRENQMHSIFAFDNDFFLDPSKLEIAKPNIPAPAPVSAPLNLQINNLQAQVNFSLR